jgi:hypothetical protein
MKILTVRRTGTESLNKSGEKIHGTGNVQLGPEKAHNKTPLR